MTKLSAFGFHPLVNEFTTCALTQMSQNISFDLGSYHNHGRLNFHVSINLRVLGLLGVALTRVDAFFGGFGLTG
jgi:hypothetical protein